MAYANWTDKDWAALLTMVRAEAPVNLSDEKIREAAFSYMKAGSDGGGNRHGLVGTHIAMCVDKVNGAVV